MKYFFLSVIFLFVGSAKPLFAAKPVVFYRKDLKILYKYTFANDTLTIIQTFLDSPYHYRGQVKGLLVKKENNDGYETWYLKLLSGLDIPVGNYEMLQVKRTENDITGIGIFTLSGYRTLELCEYAFVPKPQEKVFFDCYPKHDFDSLIKLPSFSNASETEARKVFDDLKRRLEVAKGNPNLKTYGYMIYLNFLTESFVSHGFNPFIGEKAFNIVMVKYHIK